METRTKPTWHHPTHGLNWPALSLRRNAAEHAGSGHQHWDHGVQATQQCPPKKRLRLSSQFISKCLGRSPAPALSTPVPLLWARRWRRGRPGGSGRPSHAGATARSPLSSCRGAAARLAANRLRTKPRTLICFPSVSVNSQLPRALFLVEHCNSCVFQSSSFRMLTWQRNSWFYSSQF